MHIIIYLTRIYGPVYFPRLLYYRLYCVVVKLGLTLREEHRLRAFNNKVLRKIFWVKTDQITEECYIMLSYMHCILRLTYLGILNRDD